MRHTNDADTLRYMLSERAIELGDEIYLGIDKLNKAYYEVDRFRLDAQHLLKTEYRSLLGEIQYNNKWAETMKVFH